MKLLKKASMSRMLKPSAYASTVIIALITFSNFFTGIPSLFYITLSAYQYILIICVLETLVLSVTSALQALLQKKFFYGLLFLFISILHQLSFALLKIPPQTSLISLTSPVYSFQPWLFAVLVIIYLESISRLNRIADEKRLLRGTRIDEWIDSQMRESTGNSAPESVVIRKLDDTNLAKAKGWNLHLKYLVVLGLVSIIFYIYQISDKSLIIIQWISAIPLVNSLDYLSLELRFLSLIGLGISLAVLVIGKVISETYNAAFTTPTEARHMIHQMIKDIEQNPLKSIEHEFSKATNKLQNKLSAPTGKLKNIILPDLEYFVIMSFLVIGLSLLLLQNLPSSGLHPQISAALSQIRTESQFAANTLDNLFSILTANINIAMTEIVKIVDSFFT